MTESILIVDDDRFTLAILQRRLREAGYQVQTAENGVQGAGIHA